MFITIILEATARASHGVSSTLLRRPRRVSWAWLNGPHKTLLYIVKIGIYMCVYAQEYHHSVERRKGNGEKKRK